MVLLGERAFLLGIKTSNNDTRSIDGNGYSTDYISITYMIVKNRTLLRTLCLRVGTTATTTTTTPGPSDS